MSIPSMDTQILENIGLSPGEVHVYLALLELGSSTISPLAKQSHVTASKIYPIMDRLMEKGLASFIIKNNVKYFSATAPSRIKDYLQRKEEELEEQQKKIVALLPELEAKHLAKKADVQAEVLIGWKGMETAYQEMLETLNKGDCDYVIGASAGRNYERAKSFYERIMEQAHQKGITFKVISQERIRPHFEKYEGHVTHVERRYIKIATYAETNIYKNVILIVIHGEQPTVVKITSKDAADSYIEYFNSLWNVAKK